MADSNQTRLIVLSFLSCSAGFGPIEGTVRGAKLSLGTHMPHFVHDPIRCKRARSKNMLLLNLLILYETSITYRIGCYPHVGAILSLQGLNPCCFNQSYPRRYHFSQQRMQVRHEAGSLTGAQRHHLCRRNADLVTPIGRSYLAGPT